MITIIYRQGQYLRCGRKFVTVMRSMNADVVFYLTTFYHALDTVLFNKGVTCCVCYLSREITRFYTIFLGHHVVHSIEINQSQCYVFDVI